MSVLERVQLALDVLFEVFCGANGLDVQVGLGLLERLAIDVPLVERLDTNVERSFFAIVICAPMSGWGEG